MPFCDCWDYDKKIAWTFSCISWFMVACLRLVHFWELQHITCAHKSRNALAYMRFPIHTVTRACDFLYILLLVHAISYTYCYFCYYHINKGVVNTNIMLCSFVVTFIEALLITDSVTVFDTVQYITIQYNTIQYNTIQYTLFWEGEKTWLTLQRSFFNT